MRYIKDIGGLTNNDGKTIRNNLIFRSSELANPSKQQLSFIYSKNIKTIIDMRHNGEIEKHKDYIPKGTTYFPISILEDNISAAANGTDNFERLKMLKDMPSIEETYKDFFNDEYCLKQIKTIIRKIVLENNYPILIHCVTGKDRTGIIIMLIMKLLDFSDEAIIKEYLTPKYYFLDKACLLSTLAFIFSFDFKLAKKAFYFYVVKKENIQISMDTIINKFGSFDNFFYNYIGLTKKDITDFKNAILTSKI